MQSISIFNIIIILLLLIIIIVVIVYVIYKYTKRLPIQKKELVEDTIECNKDEKLKNYTIDELREIYKFTDNDIILF